tara:strand:- start:5894 stop:7525 length:1632 start_codon:yes stop_codon:yes gene_type:complete
MATITHKVIFDLDNSKIKIEDLTNYSSGYSGNIHGVITITKNGVPFNTPGTSSSPDITVLSTDYSVLSPLQASRKFEIANITALSISDLWIFKYSVFPNGGSGSEEFAAAKDFVYSFTAPTMSLSLSASTSASQITSTDSTDYTTASVMASGVVYTITSQTRTHNLYPSAGAIDAVTGNLLPSPVDSGSAATINYTGITTGNWSSDVISVMEYSLNNPINSSTYSILTTLSGFANTNISSDLGLCDVYCCLKALNLRYEDAKCKNKDLAIDYKDKIENVTRLVTMYTQALDCGNTADAEVYLNDIKNISECSTECNCYGEGSAPANIPITSAVSSTAYKLESESSNLSISSSGSGSSADPVVYKVGLGESVAGDISYISSNISVIENQLQSIENMTNHISALQTDANPGFATQIYNVQLDTSTGYTIGGSAPDAHYNITTPSLNNKFKSSPSIIRWDGHTGSPDKNYNDWYKISNIFNSSVYNIDSVIATVSDVDNLNIEAYSIENDSFSTFRFRFLDKDTNALKTLNSLPSAINITFKIIAK